MKTSPVLQLSSICLLVLSSCCEWFGNCPPDPSYDEAKTEIANFRSDLLSLTSNNAVLVRSMQDVQLGETWILNDCDNSVHNLAVYTLEAMPGKTFSTMSNSDKPELTRSFEWMTEWAQEYEIEADIEYELLELALKAGLKDSRVTRMNLDISLKDVQVDKFRSPALIVDAYHSHLRENGGSSRGNVLVTAVFRGRMRIAYQAFNKNDKQIEFDFSASLNEVLQSENFNPGFKYFIPQSDSSNYSIIEESGENLTVFAVEYEYLDADVQDQVHIKSMINRYCDNGVKPPTRSVHGLCASTGRNVLDLTLEPGADPEKWYPTWINMTDRAITSFHYSLTVRNRYGQEIGGRATSMVIYDIAPFSSIEVGELGKLDFRLSHGQEFFDLEDVEIIFQVVEAKSGLDDVCQY